MFTNNFGSKPLTLLNTEQIRGITYTSDLMTELLPPAMALLVPDVIWVASPPPSPSVGGGISVSRNRFDSLETTVLAKGLSISLPSFCFSILACFFLSFRSIPFNLAAPEVLNPSAMLLAASSSSSSSSSSSLSTASMPIAVELVLALL